VNLTVTTISMKILVACEESQAVTKHMRALGHEAYSCDIVPCTGGRPEWHLQQDVFELLTPDRHWDMLIAFPPCTHLAASGARHFKQKIRDGRQQKAAQFFMRLVHAPVHRIAVENPVGVMSTKYRKPDQIVQPYQFGDRAQKSTCLWLKNLPLLQPTNIIKLQRSDFYEFKTRKGTRKRQSKWYYDALKTARSSADRSALRSKTFPGIAKAMAEQWAGTG
jgi:site-specific DNA-cytosine methylase